MAVKTMTSFECDLCNARSVSQQSSPPKGWVQISIDDPMLDRSWLEKAICNDCIKLIEQQKKKA